MTMHASYSWLEGRPLRTYTRELGKKPFEYISVSVKANGIWHFSINGVNLVPLLYSNHWGIVTAAGCPFTGGGFGTLYQFVIGKRTLEELGIDLSDNKITIQYQDGQDEYACHTGIEWWVQLWYQ